MSQGHHLLLSHIFVLYKLQKSEVKNFIVTVGHIVNKTFKSLELFSGAGGLALGLHQAGFQHTALVEWNSHAAKTLKLNCSSMLGLDSGSVHNIDARTFNFDVYAEGIDLLAGGPPCQPFSTGGKSLAHLDPRDMFPVFLKGVRVTRPKAILIENVKGILRERFSDYFEYIIKRIQFPFCVDGTEPFKQELLKLRLAKSDNYKADEQYVVSYSLIDTADYGVPQRRERVLIVAYRSDLNLEPKPIKKTHSKEALLYSQYVSGEYWGKHNILPSNFLGVQSEKLIKYLKAFPDNYKNELLLLPWKTVRDCIADLPDAVHRGETPLTTNHVQHPGARIYNGHIGSYHDYPAKTLKAGTHGTPGGENMLRINNTDLVRYFTTREAARLQTFPDNWHFNGETWGSCITQLGNAVPVSIARVWGQNIKDQLGSNGEKHVE